MVIARSWIGVPVYRLKTCNLCRDFLSPLVPHQAGAWCALDGNAAARVDGMLWSISYQAQPLVQCVNFPSEARQVLHRVDWSADMQMAARSA